MADEKEKNKVFLEEISKELSARADILFQFKEYYESLFNVNDRVPPFVHFYVAPLIPRPDVGGLNEFMSGLVKGNIPCIKEEAYIEKRPYNSSGMLEYLHFGHLEITDTPVTWESSRICRGVIIRDMSLLARLKKDMYHSSIAKGFSDNSTELGSKKREEITSESREDKQRSIKIWVYPRVEIMQDAYEGRLDPSTFIEVGKLLHYVREIPNNTFIVGK